MQTTVLETLILSILVQFSANWQRVQVKKAGLCSMLLLRDLGSLYTLWIQYFLRSHFPLQLTD
jgi:hypothetical protein